MLSFNRKTRISASDALKHPFFTGQKAMAEISESSLLNAQYARQSKIGGNRSVTVFDTDSSYSLSLIDFEDVINPAKSEARFDTLKSILSQSTASFKSKPTIIAYYPQISDYKIPSSINLDSKTDSVTPKKFVQSKSNTPYIQQQQIQPQSGFTFVTTWKISDFDLKERLGKGRYGIVRHVIEKRTQRHMAWKEMNYEEEEEKEFVKREKDQMINAYQTLKQSSSSSSIPVVQPYGFFVSDDGYRAYIVMEYCSGGDLRKFIDNQKKLKQFISPQKIWEIATQIISSLNQLYTSGITVHSDHRPEKVLLTSDLKVKLAEFGIDRPQQAGKDFIFTNDRMKLYKAPELLKNTKTEENDTSGNQLVIPQRVNQTRTSDIWAFGTMLFELLALRHPFIDDESLSEEEFVHRVVNEQRSNIPTHYPDSLKNLIRKMLNKDPKLRITIKEILKYPEVVAILGLN
ncbi:MAG: putative NEK protein kinase [Streblomastix strix]|uniref:non-specific serine/threonine protein kinase n=1 Tax=Streblomastix strix TaxID=222440 RepID=A0A5J4V254_9EUKA|nr:MAG: putative NEK protein kinase [Streblomastix strix]